MPKKMKIHRCCKLCLKKGKVRLGEINICDVKDGELKRVCQVHFDNWEEYYINKGYSGLFFHHDKDVIFGMRR